MVFSGYMPRSEIAVSYANSVFRFLSSLHTLVHPACYQLPLPPTVQEASLLSTPSPGFIIRQFSSVQFSRSGVSDSLQPHGLQHILRGKEIDGVVVLSRVQLSATPNSKGRKTHPQYLHNRVRSGGVGLLLFAVWT